MLTKTKCGYLHGYQKRDVKIHCAILTDTKIITRLNTNLFIMAQALHKGFQVTSEGKDILSKKFLPEISFDKKMANTSGNIFLLDHQALHEAKLCHSFGN